MLDGSASDFGQALSKNAAATIERTIVRDMVEFLLLGDGWSLRPGKFGRKKLAIPRRKKRPANVGSLRIGANDRSASLGRNCWDQNAGSGPRKLRLLDERLPHAAATTMVDNAEALHRQPARQCSGGIVAAIGSGVGSKIALVGASRRQLDASTFARHVATRSWPET